MSRVSLALCDPVTPRPSVRQSDFETKSRALERAKLAAGAELRRANRLRVSYRDWFRHRSGRLLSALRTAHCLGGRLAPAEVSCRSDFLSLRDAGRRLAAAGRRVDGLDLLDELDAFWAELDALRAEFEASVRRPAMTAAAAVSALRRPEVRDEFERLSAEAAAACDAQFPFRSVHNAQDNLFTYGVPVHDERYLGLVQGVPHAADLIGRACFLVRGLHVERA